MKATVKIYVETSVVSYYAARPSRDVVVAGHQQATRDFWERLDVDFSPYVSALVIKEAQAGDAQMAAKRISVVERFPVIEVSREAETLARTIVDKRGVPIEYPEDALHIALATVGGVDFLATWNFSHINNPFTRLRIRQIVEAEGYTCPEIVSPDELLGDGT